MSWVKIEKITQVKNNVELQAEWTPNDILINYDANWASWTVDSNAAKYDDEVILSSGTELSKTGHDFIGWSRTSDGDVKYTWGQKVSGIVDSGSITLYAVWEKKNYTITWKNSDNTTLDITESEYEANPIYSWKTPIDPTENIKCDFKEWNPKLAAVTGDIEYKAVFYDKNSNPWKCEVPYYTVIWENDNGDILWMDSIKYNNNPVYSWDKPEKNSTEQTGYTFVGWYLKGYSDENIVDLSTQSITWDRTYVAKYGESLNTYEIIFRDYNDEIIESGTYGYWTELTGDKVPSLSSYTDEDYIYIFSGWTPDLQDVTTWAEYKAKYNRELRFYNIWWSTGDNNEPYRTDKYSSNDNVSQPDNPEKTWYIFIWWSPEVSKATEDKIYVAQWNPIKYNVVYTGNSWIWTIDNQIFTYDETWTLASSWFTRDGYELTWRNTKQDGSWIGYALWSEDIYNFTSTWNEDITLYAVWTPREYIITYNTNSWTISGDYVTWYTVESGEINLPTEVSREWYTFLWWYENNEFTGERISSIKNNSTGDKQFYAQWKGKEVAYQVNCYKEEMVHMLIGMHVIE